MGKRLILNFALAVGFRDGSLISLGGHFWGVTGGVPLVSDWCFFKGAWRIRFAC